jgi:hypothetical protein
MLLWYKDCLNQYRSVKNENKKLIKIGLRGFSNFSLGVSLRIG